MGKSDGKSKGEPSFSPSGFFALRTPLRPLDDLLAWSADLEAPQALEDPKRLEEVLAADRARLRERLGAIVAAPEIRAALFVGSASLEERLADWQRDPDSKPGRKAERSVIRYFLRWTARPTPFGLFAGCATGTIGDKTTLFVEERSENRRHTRLDMDYLCMLTDALEREPPVRETLKYRPNSSLYQAAGRLRYAEARVKDRVRSHHLVAVELTDYLLATLERARGGALPRTLAAALADADPEISLDEAAAYINELIDSQILVSDLSPTVTGPEPLEGVIARLRECGAAPQAVDNLELVRAAIEAIDRDGLGVEPQRYRDIAELLEKLPAKVEMKTLFQVDMVKPGAGVTLGPEPVAEIANGARVLHRLFGRGRQNRLASFRQAFVKRYEDREVPLVEALDEEVGVGFERSTAPSAEASPLLDGLLFPSLPDETTRWGEREALLLRKFEEARATGAREVVLTSEDLERLEPGDLPPLPDAFAAMGRLVAESEAALARGEFQVLLNSVAGPSGAILLGRFCHADDVLQEHVKAHLRAEEALHPDAVFAEIVHLPEGRIGNILLRPLLRDYEIPYLGRSGAPEDRQIPVNDLHVSVVGDRIILRSARLGREVLPRLTSAHNYSLRSLGVYKFLCALQQQGVVGGLAWSWGALESARFLPRVRVGKAVLSRARWLVDRKELEALGKVQEAALFQAVQKWRAQRELPRLVVLADGDNELVIDLDNVLSVETFANLVKGRAAAALVEMFPAADQLCARGAEGRFEHEFVVPFVRTRDATAGRPQLTASSVTTSQRSLPIGSQWLYAKLYTGTSTADRVLSELVGPLARQVIASGAADQWFFIRYGDPDWHLRVRFHGEPARLHADVLPAFQAAVRPLLKQGWLWRIELGTYDREVERYGGLEGVQLAEQLFHADSEAVLAIVGLLAGDEGAEARWRLTLRGMHLLLEDLGFDLDTKLAVMKRVRAAFGREFQADTTYLKHQLGEKFRKDRKEKRLEALIDPGRDEENAELQPGFDILRQRSVRSAPVIAELKACEQAGRLSMPLADLAPSYMHMHANRLLRSVQREQELVLYDYLERLYQSQAARRRKRM